MPTLLHFAIHEAVERDGLPRVGEYDDGSRHVLYLDGAVVRSMPAADWPPPLPADPTPAEIAAAVAAREQAAQQADRDGAQLRQAIRTRLESLAGKRIDDLLVGELKTLLLYLIAREGGIDKDLKVKAPGEWGK